MTMALSNSGNDIKRLCILGGIDRETSSSLQNQANDLAVAMARAGIGLSCMANAGELITHIAQIIKTHGGNVSCVLPDSIIWNEHLLHIADEHVPAKDLQEGKMFLFRLSAGVIALPGDIRMLDILSEYLTWIQRLHYTSKPVYLVNEGSFWELLLQVFEHMENESFLPQNFHSRYRILTELREVLPDFQQTY